jgi:hypothetical protein
VRAILGIGVACAALALAACGGSQSWKGEFTSEVESVVQSTEKVSESTRSVTHQDLERAWAPYLRYGKELLAAKEQLEGLEDAPSGCARAEERALGHVRRERFEAFGMAGPQDYTPELVKSVEDQEFLREFAAVLRSVLSEAHCT